MTRPALLVLVRHGQSERNVAKKNSRFYLDDEARKAVKGIPDHLIPLTDEGRRQATLTGLAIRDTFGAFDYVFHSGYARTSRRRTTFSPHTLSRSVRTSSSGIISLSGNATPDMPTT